MKKVVKKMLKWCIKKVHLYFVVSFIRNRQFERKVARFYAQLLKRGDVYFDVGANIGNRISPIIGTLRKGKGKIVAIEPQAECVAVLKKKFGSKIVIIPKGCGEHEGEQAMAISNDDNRLSSFAAGWIEATGESGRFASMTTGWNEKRTIKMTTLDRLIEEFGTPRFIKIDVEGYELEVLKGLTQPVEMISFEYTTPESTEQCIECIKRINDISQGKILCNYSVGESMEWALPEWLSFKEMIAQIASTSVFGEGFGDIYVKYVVDK
jgi:FkbM family methyltransferase